MVNLQFVRQKKITTCKTTILLTYNSFKRKKYRKAKQKKTTIFLCSMIEKKSHQTATIFGPFWVFWPFLGHFGPIC